ncbi:MAG: conjugal transfer protein TraD, partial [Paracoccus sp. (in: a-proteobacteria)]
GRWSRWRRRRMPERESHGPTAARRCFAANRGDLHQRLTATTAALKRNRAARNRHQAQRARHDMRTWQVERRKRTRHLIELGGLAVKAGVVNLTGDDRAMIYGAMIWIAEKLKSEDGERARKLWARKGKEAFAAEQETTTPTTSSPRQDRA